jgi:hypothetical protein
MLGDATDIVCPAGTHMAGNLLVSGKKFSDKKNIFLKNNQLKQYGNGHAGFL